MGAKRPLRLVILNNDIFLTISQVNVETLAISYSNWGSLEITLTVPLSISIRMNVKSLSSSDVDLSILRFLVCILAVQLFIYNILKKHYKF